METSLPPAENSNDPRTAALPQLEKRQKRIWVAAILIAVLVGALGVAAYVLSAKRPLKTAGEHAVTKLSPMDSASVFQKDNGQPESSFLPTPEYQIVSTGESTTYHSIRYGFEFLYDPNEFILDEPTSSTEPSRFDGTRILKLAPVESVFSEYFQDCLQRFQGALKNLCDRIEHTTAATTRIELEIVNLPFDQLPVRNTESSSRLDYLWETKKATVNNLPIYRYRYLSVGDGIEAAAFSLNETQSLIVARYYSYSRESHQSDKTFETLLSTLTFIP